MGVKLNVQVASVSQVTKNDVEFLYNQPWTIDTEELLIQKVREILSVVRNNGISLHFILEITVKDTEQAIFLINNKIGHPNHITINNHKLTLREIEILGLIMLGYTNLQIADKLFVSYETVRSHRKHILEKTGARNTASLINYYHQTFFEK
jgi:DNA-binding CsgD family transcriptional regulator